MLQSIKKILHILLIVCCNYVAISQTSIEGIVKSQTSNEALPYVNIGIIGKGVGTVTNEDGQFELLLQKKHFNDSIKISMIGFQSKTYQIKDFKKVLSVEKVVFLVEKTEELNDVVITTRKLKTRILGNRSKSRKNLYEASADLLGSEIGVKIKIKRSPTQIKKFNTKVLTKKHSSFKFRLNFYTMKDGLPDENLLNENIIIDAKDIKDGFINVDLEPYNIYVEDDFFVTLEWIESDGRRKLQFPASLLGPTIVERNTSQAKWNKHTIASIGFNVTVEY